MNEEALRMKSRFSFAILGLFVLVKMTLAQEFEFYPNAKYNPAIPTLEQVVGHNWGEKITMHHEVEKYIHKLAEISKNMRVVKYGETWEGRALYYMIVASEQNLARIDDIKSGMQKLADPRQISPAEADRLISSLPAITWLAYGVHGNEISSTDAALPPPIISSPRKDTLAQIVLQSSLRLDRLNRMAVIVSSILSPATGRWRMRINGRRASARLAEQRSNHYLFDNNRDWFAMTQPETQGRVKAYLEWYPQYSSICTRWIELHLFCPASRPLNPDAAVASRWLKNMCNHATGSTA
jgi:hypothetical protein